MSEISVDHVADPARGRAQLLHQGARSGRPPPRRPARELGRAVDLPADLLHGRAEFLGGRRHRADVAGRLLGGGRAPCRLARGLGRGRGHALGGGLQLGRRGGDLADDAADRPLEPVRHLAHRGLALRLGAGAGERRLLLQPAHPHEPVLEDRDRVGDAPDLGLHALVGHRHGEIARGQRRHRPHDGIDPARDAADDDGGEHDRQQHGGAGREDRLHPGLLVGGPAVDLRLRRPGIVEGDDLLERRRGAPPRLDAGRLVEGVGAGLLPGAGGGRDRLDCRDERRPLAPERLVEAPLLGGADQGLVGRSSSRRASSRAGRGRPRSPRGRRAPSSESGAGGWWCSAPR